MSDYDITTSTSDNVSGTLWLQVDPRSQIIFGMRDLMGDGWDPKWNDPKTWDQAFFDAYKAKCDEINKEGGWKDVVFEEDDDL